MQVNQHDSGQTDNANATSSSSSLRRLKVSGVLMVKLSTLHLSSAAQMQNGTRFWRLSPPSYPRPPPPLLLPFFLSLYCLPILPFALKAKLFPLVPPLPCPVKSPPRFPLVSPLESLWTPLTPLDPGTPWPAPLARPFARKAACMQAWDGRSTGSEGPQFCGPTFSCPQFCGPTCSATAELHQQNWHAKGWCRSAHREPLFAPPEPPSAHRPAMRPSPLALQVLLPLDTHVVAKPAKSTPSAPAAVAGA